MPTLQQVRDALAPLASTVATLDLSDPRAAEQALEERHPHAGLADLGELLRDARDEGVLTPRRGSETLTFGRVAKPTQTAVDLSIDAVDMSGVGPEHTHPEGEVSLCFAEQGDPRFDGHPEGWVVLPPDSHHAPTVEGGRMLIVYFLPGGAVKWGPRDQGEA